MLTLRERQAVRIMSAQEAVKGAGASAPEGPIVKVVLLTEGLGNKRDLNYYGPEAVRSMPQAFEGAVCMVDHPSYSEEKDIPEGRVNKTVGYYKNLHVESVQTPEGPRIACVGELHFDLSQEGVNAYQKCKTAVHYDQEFPGSLKPYIGLSINAYGESEPRRMEIDGEELEVNYVTRFAEVRSCDLVTIPARGGKIVALVESIAGAKNKEVRTMIIKSLQEAHKALEEAKSEKDPALREKKITEAQRVIESLSTELVAKAKAAEAKKSKQDETEDEAETESEDEARRSKQDEAEDEDEDEDEPPARKTKASRKSKQKQGESDREAYGLAVKALVSESGLNPKYFDLDELSHMSLQEAKREIARTKRVHEASVEELLKKMGDDVAPAHRARESGSGGDTKATRNADFAVISA